MACRLAALLLLVSAAGFVAGNSPAAAPKKHTASDLALLASSGDALQLWRAATTTAAAACVEALRQQYASSHSVEQVDPVELDQLRIWHGQSVTLGLEADKQQLKWVVSPEPNWKRLADVLPRAQGGLLSAHDWDRLEREWLSPVSRGSLLPDFALQGPLDIWLQKPTALQLFLPHASDAGQVQRVLLRDGATVAVRGATAVKLRRPLDLPPISLSQFADIVTSDAAQQQALGVMHLLAGVHEAATAAWNASHPDQSLGLVSLELELSHHGAALLAAGGQRLRVRRVKAGVIELVPRDAHPSQPPPAGAPGAQQGQDAAAVALPSQDAAQPEATAGAWPLPSVDPIHLQAYERLLRQVLGSRLFQTGGSSFIGGGIRIAQDVQLRLLETAAQATTLLQLQLELERRPQAAEAPAGRGAAVGGKPAAGASGGGQAQQLFQMQQQQQQQQEKAVAPPDPLLVMAAPREGPRETWIATVQVKGEAQRGTLKFVPLHMQRLGVQQDTVQFAPGALDALLGNATAAQLAGLLGAQAI